MANGSTYGSDVNSLRDRDDTLAGTMVRMSLVAAPTAPDPRTDIGHHEFDWPYCRASVAPLVAAAGEINAPTIENMPDIAAPTLEPIEGTPVIDWIKLADDGSGDIVADSMRPPGRKPRQCCMSAVRWTAGRCVRRTRSNRMNLPDEPAGLIGGKQQAETNWRSPATDHIAPSRA
ncbi:MAG: hypothetical protein ACLT4Y_06520 [Bifidobacterium breve]